MFYNAGRGTNFSLATKSHPPIQEFRGLLYLAAKPRKRASKHIGKGATDITVGWFTGCTCKNHSKSFMCVIMIVYTKVKHVVSNLVK
jgi:hypothetical protein